MFLFDILSGYAMGYFFSIVLGNLILFISSFVPSISALNALGLFLISFSGPLIGFFIGTKLKLPHIGLLSTLIAGTIGATYPKGGMFLSFICAVIVALVLQALHDAIEKTKDAKKKLSKKFVFPLVAIVLSSIIVHFGGPYVSKFLQWLAGYINTYASSTSFKGKILNGMIYGILSITPFNIITLSPFLTITPENLTYSLLGIMAFQCGMGACSKFDNNLADTVSIMMGGGPSLCGNMIKNPLCLFPPLLAIPCLVLVNDYIFHITTTLKAVQYGNAGFLAITETTMNGMNRFSFVIIFIFLVGLSALFTFAFFTIFAKLGFIRTGNLKIEED